jgi:uncharacterized protein YndB with AHSA1/START domain
MPTVRRLVEIEAPPRDVWHVLTSRELVREWASVYGEEMDVASSWRVGGRITWKTPDGAVDRRGVIAELAAERRLRFTYADVPDAPYEETFDILPDEPWSRLVLTIGPVDAARCEALEALAEEALNRIRGLTEELAWIRKRRALRPEQ